MFSSGMTRGMVEQRLRFMLAYKAGWTVVFCALAPSLCTPRQAPCNMRELWQAPRDCIRTNGIPMRGAYNIPSR